jgi:hypothetical protein
MRLLEVKTESDGNKIISGNTNIRFLNSSDKDIAKKSFEELPTELQERFKTFQLLKYGLSNKLGSLISIMPQDFGSEMLQDMSKVIKRGPTGMEVSNNIDGYNVPLNYIMANPQSLHEMDITTKTTQVIKGETYAVRENSDGVMVPYSFGALTKGDQGDKYVKSESGQIYLLNGRQSETPGRLSKIKGNFSKSRNHVMYDPNAYMITGQEVMKEIQEGIEMNENC